LKGATVPVATVLEAVVQKDVPLPAECAGGLGAGECPTQLMTRCVRPAMAQLAARAYLLCRLQGAAEAEVGAQLESPDAWARGEAATVAGERGLKGLIPLLLKHMGEEDLLVAYPCIGALGRLGSDAQVAELVKRAERAPEFLVQAVAVALKDINTPLSRQYLESWAKSHPAESVRELAGKLLSSGSDAGGAVPPAK
jgi:hypothetical protein